MRSPYAIWAVYDPPARQAGKSGGRRLWLTPNTSASQEEGNLAPLDAPTQITPSGLSTASENVTLKTLYRD